MGCVDWNLSFQSLLFLIFCRTSHGVRGLKSDVLPSKSYVKYVAPRMGCVDWNFEKFVYQDKGTMVAPRMGCVDWNFRERKCVWHWKSRTSHGVRGLKFLSRQTFNAKFSSHLAWGAWIEIIFFHILIPFRGLSHLAWGAWIEILPLV